MTEYEELKQKALAAISAEIDNDGSVLRGLERQDSLTAFFRTASPKMVMGLISELEQARSAVTAWEREFKSLLDVFLDERAKFIVTNAVGISEGERQATGVAARATREHERKVVESIHGAAR